MVEPVSHVRGAGSGRVVLPSALSGPRRPDRPVGTGARLGFGEVDDPVLGLVEAAVGFYNARGREHPLAEPALRQAVEAAVSELRAARRQRRQVVDIGLKGDAA